MTVSCGGLFGQQGFFCAYCMAVCCWPAVRSARRAQSLEDEIRLLRQQAAARRLQPRPAPGNELLEYLRTLEPSAVAELTAGADSDILGAPLLRAQPEAQACTSCMADVLGVHQPWSHSKTG